MRWWCPWRHPRWRDAASTAGNGTSTCSGFTSPLLQLAVKTKKSILIPFDFFLLPSDVCWSFVKGTRTKVGTTVEQQVEHSEPLTCNTCGHVKPVSMHGKLVGKAWRSSRATSNTTSNTTSATTSNTTSDSTTSETKRNSSCSSGADSVSEAPQWSVPCLQLCPIRSDRYVAFYPSSLLAFQPFQPSSLLRLKDSFPDTCTAWRGA